MRSVSSLAHVDGCFVQESYSQLFVQKGKIKEEDLDLYVFASKPAAGAAVLKL
jgi:N-acetylgalactosamine kinase